MVRLKGGDPFVFGRGGEEAEALVAAGLRFEVVPGVSAGVAVPAYAGIPLTHRTIAGEVVFVTGHDSAESVVPVDWARHAASNATLVVFMGLEHLGEIAVRLLEHGRPPDCPVAVIAGGTTAEQRTVVAPLATIAAATAAAGLTAPALIVVGEVVALRERLQWFERSRRSGTPPSSRSPVPPYLRSGRRWTAFAPSAAGVQKCCGPRPCAAIISAQNSLRPRSAAPALLVPHVNFTPACFARSMNAPLGRRRRLLSLHRDAVLREGVHDRLHARRRPERVVLGRPAGRGGRSG